MDVSAADSHLGQTIDPTDVTPRKSDSYWNQKGLPPAATLISASSIDGQNNKNSVQPSPSTTNRAMLPDSDDTAYDGGFEGSKALRDLLARDGDGNVEGTGSSGYSRFKKDKPKEIRRETKLVFGANTGLGSIM